MHRRFAILSTVAAALALAGCVGDTDPATNVTSKTAQLNAHGRTNDGPASWWWEYSTSRSTVEANGGTEVCGSPPEADGRCGPAQGPSGTDIPLSFKLTGLTPSTTYWFRVCGQDVNDASPTCGRVLSFTTLAEYYVFHSKLGSFGTGLGQFKHPTGITVATDSAGNPRLKIADADNNRIALSTLEPLQVTSTFTDSAFLFPRAIARDHLNNVFVTDSNGIKVYDPANTRLAAWGDAQGSGDGQFSAPAGIAVQREASGPFALRRVYVVDQGNDRIQKFDASGVFITKWGTSGTGPGQLESPVGIAVRGNVYVADNANNRIQVFSPTGAYLSQWPVANPTWLAIDGAGNVFVASSQGLVGNVDEILKFTASGVLVTRFGRRGDGDGQFTGFGGITIDSAGDVYATDFWNNRIQKFKKE